MEGEREASETSPPALVHWPGGFRVNKGPEGFGTEPSAVSETSCVCAARCGGYWPRVAVERWKCG